MRLWRRGRALALMGRHERWRVAMGCPGAVRPAPIVAARTLDSQEEITYIPPLDPLTPRRGEVYCRCTRCHAARELVGWEPLR